jgi:hypothetical protein
MIRKSLGSCLYRKNWVRGKAYHLRKLVATGAKGRGMGGNLFGAQQNANLRKRRASNSFPLQNLLAESYQFKRREDSFQRELFSIS